MDQAGQPRAGIAEEPGAALDIGAGAVGRQAVRVVRAILIGVEQRAVGLRHHADAVGGLNLRSVAAVAEDQVARKGGRSEGGIADGFAVERIAAENLRALGAGGEVAAVVVEHAGIGAAGACDVGLRDCEAEFPRAQHGSAVEALVRRRSVAIGIEEQVHVTLPAKGRRRIDAAGRDVRSVLFVIAQEFEHAPALVPIRAVAGAGDQRGEDQVPLAVVLIQAAGEVGGAAALGQQFGIGQRQAGHAHVVHPLVPAVADAAGDQVAALRPDQVATNEQVRRVAQDLGEWRPAPALGAGQRAVGSQLHGVEVRGGRGKEPGLEGTKFPVADVLPAIVLGVVDGVVVVLHAGGLAERRAIAGLNDDAAGGRVNGLNRAILPEAGAIGQHTGEAAVLERAGEGEQLPALVRTWRLEAFVGDVDRLLLLAEPAKETAGRRKLVGHFQVEGRVGGGGHLEGPLEDAAAIGDYLANGERARGGEFRDPRAESLVRGARVQRAGRLTGEEDPDGAVGEGPELRGQRSRCRGGEKLPAGEVRH